MNQGPNTISESLLHSLASKINREKAGCKRLQSLRTRQELSNHNACHKPRAVPRRYRGPIRLSWIPISKADNMCLCNLFYFALLPIADTWKGVSVLYRLCFGRGLPQSSFQYCLQPTDCLSNLLQSGSNVLKTSKSWGIRKYHSKQQVPSMKPAS